MTALDKLELTIPVQGGRLNPSPDQKARIAGFLARRGDKPVVVKIAKPVNSRSVRQNSYYWGCCLTLLAASTGHTTEELHIAIKDELLPRKFIKIGAKELEVRKSTADLDTAEFEQYLERFRAFAAAQLGIVIPMPNE